MKKTQAGLEFNVLVMLIVCIVGGILLLIYLSDIMGSFERKTELETCRLSVIANSKTEQQSISLMTSPINCPAEVLRLADTQKVTYEIAHLMENCWYKMGEGKIPVFGRSWTRATSSCLVCSEFVLTKNFETTIIKNYLNSKIPSKEQTYLEYLNVLNQPKALSSEIFFVDVGEEFIANSGKTKSVAKPLTNFIAETPYFVLFLRQQKSVVATFFSFVMDPAIAVVSKILGSEPIQDTQTLFIVPRDKLNVLKIDDNPLCQDLYWEIGQQYEK